MSTRLRIQNFSSNNIRERAQVSFDAAADQAVIKFDNVDQLAAADVVVVGRVGTNSAEFLTVQSISGLNVTFTTNLTKEHRRYQPIVILRGNQIKLYRAANVDGTAPAVAAFSFISPATNLDPDDTTTDVEDSTGSSDYWYRYTYYHSTALTETELADCPAVRGGSYGHYAPISEIRDKAGFTNNENITDQQINTARLAAEGEINTALNGMYELPFSEPIPPTIAEITRLIAAGILLNNEHGPFNSGGTSARGEAKLKEGRALLANIKNRSSEVQDSTLTSLLNSTAQSLQFLPDDDTTYDTDSLDGAGGRAFRTGMKF